MRTNRKQSFLTDTTQTLGFEYMFVSMLHLLAQKYSTDFC